MYDELWRDSLNQYALLFGLKSRIGGKIDASCVQGRMSIWCKQIWAIDNNECGFKTKERIIGTNQNASLNGSGWVWQSLSVSLSTRPRKHNAFTLVLKPLKCHQLLIDWSI
ncbi:hypothetical protein MT418_005737 [Batrachochytrium dendrobatidis]